MGWARAGGPRRRVDWVYVRAAPHSPMWAQVTASPRPGNLKLRRGEGRGARASEGGLKRSDGRTERKARGSVVIGRREDTTGRGWWKRLGEEAGSSSGRGGGDDVVRLAMRLVRVRKPCMQEAKAALAPSGETKGRTDRLDIAGERLLMEDRKRQEREKNGGSGEQRAAENRRGGRAWGREDGRLLPGLAWQRLGRRGRGGQFRGVDGRWRATEG